MTEKNLSAGMNHGNEYSIIGEFVENSTKCGLIGGYCEDGFPIYYVNDTMVKMLGYDSKDEFLEAIDGKVANTIHHDDMLKVIEDLGGGHFYEGMTYETSYRVPRKDGTYFWTMDRGKVIRTDDGRLAIISMCSDLSIVVNRYKDIEAENFRNRQTLLNIPGGYHRCSKEEGYPFLYISDRFLEITGWTREEIKEKFDNKFMNMIYPDDEILVDEYVKVVEKHKSDNENYTDGIYRISCTDGYRWFSDASVWVRIGNEDFIQGIISDITPFIEKEKKIQDELAAALKKSEEAAQAKTNFLFNMSHEIRTPLNAILGFNEIARKYIDNHEKVMDALNKSSIAGHQLLGTINEILDMSRIENGKLEFNVGTIDVKKYINSLQAVFGELCREKELEFETIDNTQIPYVCGDGQRISQIMTNLLGNAVKFTPGGGKITFRIDEEVSEDNKSDSYTVSIKDTGIGMSKEFQTRMYDKFEREVDSNHLIQGSGLGLTIVKRVADEMHATIDCESELGKGTEFTVRFTLPITKVADKAQENVQQRADLKGVCVLLAEDNELNREIATVMLEDCGCIVETAENGLIAVEKLMNAPFDHYKVILMDIQMPIMNGYKATSEIRSLKDLQKASVPIIAMTANAFAEDRRKAFEAGVNGYIAKPIKQEDLISTIAEYMR